MRKGKQNKKVDEKICNCAYFVDYQIVICVDRSVGCWCTRVVYQLEPSRERRENIRKYGNSVSATLAPMFAAGSVVKTFVITDILLVQLWHQCSLMTVS